MAKLIIIRGQSGSGKSSLAKLLRTKTDPKTALIEQDYIRRNLLGDIGRHGNDDVELLELAVKYALDIGYDVILEGILQKEYYADMMHRLLKYNRDNIIVFYDIPLEETFLRHKTKANSHEFGEEDMRKWYRENEELGVSCEIILKKDKSLEDAVTTIAKLLNN